MIIYVFTNWDVKNEPASVLEPRSMAILMRGYLGGYPARSFEVERRFFQWATDYDVTPAMLGDPEEEFFYDTHVVQRLTQEIVQCPGPLNFVLPDDESKEERIVTAMVCAAALNLRAMGRTVRVTSGNRFIDSPDEWQRYHDAIISMFYEQQPITMLSERP